MRKKYIILPIILILFFFSFKAFSQDYTEDSLAVVGILAANPEVYPFQVDEISNAENGRIITLGLWGPPVIEDDNYFESQYKLFKIIPDCVSKLTALKQISCISQDIFRISPEIAKLDSLIHVSILYNEYYELHDFIEIFDIPNLKYLSVANSHHDNWGIPKEIEKLILLETLDISYCGLNELPSEIGNLTSLKRINCYQNNYMKIPEEFYNLTSLTYFNFGYSGSASYPLSPKIGNLINLDTLDLIKCCLYTLPDSIVKLQKLTYLDLGYNYINPDNLSPEVIAWADKFDPDWKNTQTTPIIYNQSSFINLNLITINLKNSLIQFNLPNSGKTKLKIYNVKGRLLATLVDSYKQAGNYKLKWDSKIFGSGVYFLKLSINGSAVSKKFTIIK